jgi:D-ribulokinase
VTASCFIGIDVGTSGCRATAIDADATVLAQDRRPLPAPMRSAGGGVEQRPAVWWEAVVRLLQDLATDLGARPAAALCVDATSATVLLCTRNGEPLGPALMYNDRRSTAAAERIARIAPADSPARGAGSSLAKLLYLRGQADPPEGTLVLHQADWIEGRLTGQFGLSDWNNSLKLGYDPAAERWPDWLEALALAPVGLPRVVAPGSPLGHLDPQVLARTGLAGNPLVRAGTTDSTAAVIAAGAAEPGEAVTSLGSTLVVKILGKSPVWAPEFGVYSHRLGDLWLIGGASNTGGAVLRRYFDDAAIERLTQGIRPDAPTGLDYYPLPGPGERFPVNDPALPPRLAPRPADDLRFFHGLLEGMARIEAEGYRRLQALGAPAPRRVMTIGGGAGNRGWTRIRERLLGVPVTRAAAQEAAFGAALLALRGPGLIEPRRR